MKLGSCVGIKRLKATFLSEDKARLDFWNLIWTDNSTLHTQMSTQKLLRNMGIVVLLWATILYIFQLSCRHYTPPPKSAQWLVPDNTQGPEWPNQKDFGAPLLAQGSKSEDKQWTSEQQIWGVWAGGRYKSGLWVGHMVVAVAPMGVMPNKHILRWLLTRWNTHLRDRKDTVMWGRDR